MLNWWLKKKLIKNDTGIPKVTLPIKINNLIHAAKKEWFNSVYTYDKEYIKSLIHNHSIINNLIQKVFNWDKNNKKHFLKKYRLTIKKRTKSKPFTTKYKIFVSRADIKHINKKVIITFYIYNSLINTFNKKLKLKRFSLLKLSHNILYKYKNGLKSLSKIKNNNKKYTIFFYLLSALLKRKKKFYLKKLISYLILKKKIMLIVYKFEQFLIPQKPNLLYLIEHLYDKEVEFKIINLKLKHFNSDILSQYIVTKLKNRENRLLKVLKRSIKNVKVMPRRLYLIKKNDIDLFKGNVLNYIKYKAISGVRLEARGRLTRRLTASRSIFKFKYIGSLKDMDSSYKNQSSPVLRGNQYPNLQYTLINSKTRNGAFGLRSWIGSY